MSEMGTWILRVAQRQKVAVNLLGYTEARVLTQLSLRAAEFQDDGQLDSAASIPPTVRN